MPQSPSRAEPSLPELGDYPVRDYIRAMAVELAHMARMERDATLAQALELAADLARPPR